MCDKTYRDVSLPLYTMSAWNGLWFPEPSPPPLPHFDSSHSYYDSQALNARSFHDVIAADAELYPFAPFADQSYLTRRLDARDGPFFSTSNGAAQVFPGSPTNLPQFHQPCTATAVTTPTLNCDDSFISTVLGSNLAPFQVSPPSDMHARCKRKRG